MPPHRQFPFFSSFSIRLHYQMNKNGSCIVFRFYFFAAAAPSVTSSTSTDFAGALRAYRPSLPLLLLLLLLPFHALWAPISGCLPGTLNHIQCSQRGELQQQQQQQLYTVVHHCPNLLVPIFLSLSLFQPLSRDSHSFPPPSVRLAAILAVT